MSLQGRANGLLGQVLGHAVFAALVSFVVGLLCVGIALVVSARSRGAARRLVALLRELIVDSTDLQPGGRQRLGVLLLSLFALFGNLVGALALDALLPIPGSDVTLTTVLSAAGVLVGIVTVLPVPVRRSSGTRREPASRT